MSLIFIKKHNENIYDITEKAAAHSEKPQKYVSKFRKNVKNTIACEKDKKGFGIMGPPPEVLLPDVTKFLKKHTGEKRLLEKKIDQPQEKMGLKVSKLPPVPHTVDLLKENEEKLKNRETKNFICLNIKHVLKQKPKEPERKVVIERYGESKELSRGLEPQYIYSSVFGKTPRYLQHIIEERAKQEQLKKDASGSEQPMCRYITREEREKLLAGLKQNWVELQQQYQGLPILTDTIPKINRKSKMEADLKQLEKDIVLIERHPYIYVYDDNDNDLHQ